ncbi:MAG: long-chain-fatty-acid--CoA ligase [Alphaproteobacteria bacterium]|nr:long-chain-fatty-acid--CoA ligase [Alphaproteobacteria bacterium]MDX5370063.1 long-chain-fatty-acid--CoA ligase [Alphaproteobacteria bacterium]MDX5464641.1 long-chain-fatty-acid--CoA ligase [Alphaproteobacteria bacterium]
MLGLMQDWPLLCTKILDHAATYHGGRSVVTRTVEGPIHRTTYADIHLRARKVAQALVRDGIGFGDRVATMATNTYRHLEAWYGILGIGAVYHTVNPRLFHDQIVYIMNHAEDRILLVDAPFVPIIEANRDQLPKLEKVVVLCGPEDLPQSTLDLVSFEDWIAPGDGDFAWAAFDENTAAGMCYTSGTTGNPKGVVYSHRSNVLHALAVSVPDMLNLSMNDVVMPVVPLFHANGWSLAFSAPLNGSALVMPGARMDGEAIYELLETEKVTFTAAVPTVWLMLLQHMEKHDLRLTHLKRVAIGGSAVPRAMIEKFQDNYGVEVIHAWGMTEMSPIGSGGTIKPEYRHLTGAAKIDLQLKQGHPPFTVEMKITDDANNPLPWDGKTFGRLKVRGPCVARSYFRGEGGEILDEQGFFDTGDVSTMDPHGYMHITDRAKDVIKSGGEWISSIDLENEAVGCPGVAEAAVIGVAHPKWDERPLLVIVRKDGAQVTKEQVLDHLASRVAKFWMPDDVVFVDEIPHTATGKIQKMALREQFSDYRLPTVDAAE